jgi:hypothetical protein
MQGLNVAALEQLRSRLLYKAAVDDGGAVRNCFHDYEHWRLNYKVSLSLFSFILFFLLRSFFT